MQSTRRKPYTKKLMIADIILTLLTGGWLIVVGFRELYQHRS